ncbi:MAG: DUF2863 family protein [Zoogloeaceae bacterium]|jgi:hypothetical protein|nr:DUF2863 family protein [Zoogloeaceae bacterium]
MKRSRLSARERLSRNAAELQRLAIGLSESGGRLEDIFWESLLVSHTRTLIQDGAEEDLNAALDRLYESSPAACDELVDVVEAEVESCILEMDGKQYDIQLFAAPILVWSRYVIPSGSIGSASLVPIKTQLGAHVFSADVRLALADYLFSPDQLPHSYCDTWKLLQSLVKAAIKRSDFRLDGAQLPETFPFLSDVRYLLGVAMVPHGTPVFRWNESDGNRDTARSAWEKQGGANFAAFLTGCAYQLLLPNAYHFACRSADLESRAYAVKASIAFLQASQGLMPEELRAVIAPCYDQRLEEYRIGFAPRDQDHQVFHGVVWTLLGAEDEHSEVVPQIEAILCDCGVQDIVALEHRMPLEFCDDCGAPMFPTAEGDLVHAEMPEQNDAISQTLH